MTAALIQFDPLRERHEAVRIARSLWTREERTVPTRLENDDTNCVLCGFAIPEGAAWFIPDEERYAGPCCYDLAVYSGVTRWETENIRPGTPIVPAHLAVRFPPNVQRIKGV